MEHTLPIQDNLEALFILQIVSNKNDKLNQGSKYCHVFLKLCFRLDRKIITHFDTSCPTVSVQHYIGIRHVILKAGSDTMPIFGLQSKCTSYINGQRNCLYYQHVGKHFLQVMMSLLTKALSVDKQRQSLLDLVISSRFRNHYLWLLKQSYSIIPKMSKKAS